MIGEQPAAVVVGSPYLVKRLEHGLGQRHQPLFVTLADDAQHPAGPVDGRHLQRQRFADTQSAGYMRARQVRWTGLRKPTSRCRACSSVSHSGSRFCRGRAILFFPKQRPNPVERLAEEEPQPGASNLEGAARRTAPAQVQQVGPDLLLAQLIRRTPMKVASLEPP